MIVEPEHLIAFARIAAEGSVTRAAEALHRSQPAVSQQMSRLREAVGDPLYRRTRYGVALTPAGEALLPHAEALARALAGARGLAAGIRGLERGRLRVAASTTVAGWWLPTPLARFAAAHPGLELRLLARNTHDAVALLARGEADLAVVEGPEGGLEPPPGVEVAPLGADRIVLACRPDHPLARRVPLDPDALDGLALVRREPGSGTREIVDRALAAAGARPATRLEATGVEGVVACLRAGVAPGFVSSLAIADDLAAGRLVEVRVKGMRLERRFTRLAPPEAQRSPAARAFLEELEGREAPPEEPEAPGGAEA